MDQQWTCWNTNLPDFPLILRALYFKYHDQVHTAALALAFSSVWSQTSPSIHHTRVAFALSLCFRATWIFKQENWNRFLITGLGSASQLLWWMHAPVTFPCSLGTRCKHKLSPAHEILIFLGGATAVSGEGFCSFTLPCMRQWCLCLQFQPAHDRALLTGINPLQF